MSYGAEPLRIIFDKADEKCKKLFERIRYLVTLDENQN